MRTIKRWYTFCVISVLCVAIGYWSAVLVAGYPPHPADSVDALRVSSPGPAASHGASALRGDAMVSTPATPLSGKVPAAAESSCTSLTGREPIDLHNVHVTVGKVAGRAGTSAQVTMNYTGEVPTTGVVLWTLLATNPAGSTIQLDYRTLDGQNASYGMGASADTDTPGEIVLVLPQVGLEMLGPVWWWSAVISIDGRVIDSCPDAG